MKKSVLFLALLLVMTNFVLAESYCAGRGVSGVEIGGECFDCGRADDGICPEDFGADCSANFDLNCEVEETDVTAPFWSLDGTNKIPGNYLVINLLDGKSLYLVVPETSLGDGEIVDFEIIEDDPIINDDLRTIQGIASGGRIVASYNITSIENVNDAGEGDSEDTYLLFFKADGSYSTLLEIELTIEAVAGIETCSDYLDNVSCEDNLGQAGILEGAFLEYSPGCLRKENLVGCQWDSTASTCGPAPSEIEYSPSNNLEICDQTVTSCTYVEAGSTGCEAGDDFFKVSYTSSETGCEAWTSAAVPCPQELKLPFFGIYSFIVTLSFISLIYAYLIFKKR